MLKKKKKSAKNKDGEFEDEEDEVMMAQMAAKGAGTLQYTKPAAEPLIEIEAKKDPMESEEWQKFNALLNKTQETVTNTQTKMSKLADSSTSASANKTTSSSTAAPSWASFEPESDQQQNQPSESSAQESSSPTEQSQPTADETQPEVVPEEAPTLSPQRHQSPEPAALVPDPAVRTPSPDSSSFSHVHSTSHSEFMRTPIDNTVMASSTTSTGTVVAVEPPRPRSPPTSAVARPRPKASDIALTTPSVPIPAPTVPEPSPFSVPDIFDTSKFLDGAVGGTSSGGGSDNPFESMLDTAATVDAGAEDFFAKFSSTRGAATEAWGGATSSSNLLPVPGKTFDQLQTYTDDEGAATDSGLPDGGFSSANNPFRLTSSPPETFGAGDDLFAQLATIGGSSSGAATASAGADWDEFDPFCERKKTSSDQAPGFTADFGGASKASSKRAQMDKDRQNEGSQQSSVNSGGSINDNDYDSDSVEKLAPFHEQYRGQWFQMGLRQPPKKSKMPFTGQRGWRTTYARIENDPKNQNVYVKLYLSDKDATASKNPLMELKLDPYMTLSEIGMQPFDEYGKVYTTKVYRTDYKERPALRTDKFTPKGLSLTSIKDLKRLITKPKTTMILDHSPQHDELMKLGALNYEELKQFRWCFEDAMMRVITKRAQTSQQYTKDEIIAEIIDEYEASVDKYGHITEQKARVRVYCLSFLSGMAFVEFGVNDIRRKGKEVVRRQDIIPMRTETWIRIEDYQFHCCVNTDEFNKSTVIRFQPPDGINVEILRFRVRPRKNFQLPLQVRAIMNLDRTNRDVDIRMEVLIPGYFSNSRKANQAPCENIAIAFPIPEPWIYYFRVEHVWGYGSVHAHKARPGKVKGLDRITNMAEGLIPKGSNPTNCTMEVNTGDCKYEHLLNGLVWRIPRLPERFQGAYKTHLLQVKIPLGPHDPIPDNFEKSVTVDYTMPATSVSRAMIRSISSTSQADEPPDKWVKQLARYYYKVDIEYTFEVRSKGESVEKPATLELPSSIVPGEKLALSAQPSANPPESVASEPGQKLAVSGDEDSSEDEAKTSKKPSATSPPPAAVASSEASSAKPSQLKVSDESDTESDDEDDRPKFKIQLNPVIQSFIEKGGAMVNGAIKKKPEPEPPRPPPPNQHHSEPPRRPLSPEADAESEDSDEDNKKAAQPKRPPPPPRPAAPGGGGASSGASGGKKWTVIAEADQPPKSDSET